MSELPSGWDECVTDDIAEVVGGATPKSKDPSNFTDEGGISWLTPADLSGYKDMFISRGKRNITEKGYASCSAKLMPPGSVLFSSRAPIGYVVIAQNEICTNQGFKSFVPYSGINSKYLYYYLRFAKDKAELLASGTTFQEISGKKAAQIPMILAPSNEQKRIAEKLDQILEEVNSAKVRLDKIPTILKNFRQSLIDQYIGKVNADKNLGAIDLQDICHSISDGDHQAPPKTDQGIPFLVISNITKGFVDLDGATRFVSEEYYNNLKDIRTPRRGNILYSVTGSIGIPVVVETDKEFCFQRHIAIIKPNNELVLTKFLQYYLKSSFIFKQAESVATGTAQMTVPLGGLRGFQLKTPSLDAQKEIVRVLDEGSWFANQIEEKYNLAREQVDKITQSVLAKAFRGELVPQDPNDEPASVLLERIKAEKEVSAFKPKPKRKKKNTVIQPEPVKLSIKAFPAEITIMSRTTKENVLKEIDKLSNDIFSFNDIKEKFPSDYDSLKDIIFDLLDDPKSGLSQTFDKNEKEMRFVRSEK